MNLIVFGKDSYIGKEVYEHRISTVNVYGTTRRKQNSNRNVLFFDILNDDYSSLTNIVDDRTAKSALICLSVTSIDQCKKQYELSYEINVRKTKKLIEWLSIHGYHIIFLSSDQVFDGTKGKYNEDDIINPINSYGNMKAEVEDFIQMSYMDACILRLSKVIGKENSRGLLFEWNEKAKKGEDIYCIKDNYFSPVLITDVVDNIFMIAQNRMKGIYHLGGPKRYLRSELCHKLISKHGYHTIIKDMDSDFFGFLDNRPLDTSLISNKILSFGGKSTNIELFL